MPDAEALSVSVVIGVYNAERWIAETIASVLGQTWRDFELVVVDDGSTDATAQIVRGFGEAVRLIQKENGGSASARNAGIRASRGRYVAFLDADDLWEPKKLEVQMQLQQNNPAPAWSYTDALFFEAATGRLLYRADQLTTAHEGDVLRPLLLGNFITFSTVVVRRDVFDEVGHFNEDPLHRISEDWDLWLRIAAWHPVGYLARPLTRMRQHAQRKTDEMDLEHALKSRMALVERAVIENPDRLAGLHDRARANLYVNIGRKRLEREERAEARRLFRQALRHTPSNAQAWIYGLATLLPRPVLRLIGSWRQHYRNRQRVEQASAYVKEGAESTSCV